MPKTLIYDGDCPMCVWIARRFGDLGLAADGRRRPYQSFEGDLANRLEAAGIRNEMLVLDAESAELRSGIEGFLWLLDDTRFRRLGAVFSLPPIRGLLRLVYRTIAYNRRILAPPPRGIVCACDPDPHPGFRALFLVSLMLLDLAGAWLFGRSVAAAFPGPGAAWISALAVLAVLSTLVILRVSLEVEPLILVGNVLVLTACGVLVATPGLVLSLWLGGASARLVVVSSLVLGVWTAVAGARRRLFASRTRARAGQVESNR